MRRSLGFLLTVLLASGLGCHSLDNTAHRTLEAGPATGDRDLTLEYWSKVREALQTRCSSNQLRDVATVVRHQVDVVRNLPAEGVDVELVAAADALARSQEAVLEAGEVAGFNPAALRVSPEVMKAYTQAGQQTAAATARLKALQPKLSARYGVKFPQIEG